jgi:hypothetical protein
MIDEVDEALRRLVLRDAVNGSGVELSFEAPTKDWAARRNAPTVDVYLYDVREDVSRREMHHEPIRDENGRVVGRKLPPRRFRLSYLVTVWTARPEDEHRVLSTLLACFLRHQRVPPELLPEGLASHGLPVVVEVGLPPPKDRSLADVWSALGGELKPSLDLTVTAPLDPAVVLAAGPPVLEELRLRVAAGDAVDEPRP